VLYLVLVLWLGCGVVAEFVHVTAASWANLTGVLFAASLTVWIVFVNMAATEFGDYLRLQNDYRAYYVAFVFPMFVLFGATCLLIISVAQVPVAVSNVAMGLLIYAVINVVTLVKNATGIVDLQATFKDCVRKAVDARPDTSKLE